MPKVQRRTITKACAGETQRNTQSKLTSRKTNSKWFAAKAIQLARVQRYKIKKKTKKYETSIVATAIHRNEKPNGSRNRIECDVTGPIKPASKNFLPRWTGKSVQFITFRTTVV